MLIQDRLRKYSTQLGNSSVVTKPEVFSLHCYLFAVTPPTSQRLVKFDGAICAFDSWQTELREVIAAFLVTVSFQTQFPTSSKRCSTMTKH